MLKQRFHHGNLRAELLDRAEVALRERGAETLSLRELARDAGVSHGAPRSHFIDRGALLNALAERGFDRLSQSLNAAVQPRSKASGAGASLLRAAARAYLEFAVNNPALLALMVAAKADAPTGVVHDAGSRLFSTMMALVTETIGAPSTDDEIIARLTLLLSATMQGISSLVVSGRVPAATGSILLDDAVRVFVAGAFGKETW